MATALNNDQVSEAIEKLHRQLELPYVSGELSSWTDGIIELLGSTKECIRKSIEDDHPCSYKTIMKNDLELAQRVEDMRAEDAQLLCKLDDLTREAENLDKMVDEAHLAESQFKPKRDRLVEDGVAFIVRLRKQRAAINTWLGEAFSRDNGRSG